MRLQGIFLGFVLIALRVSAQVPPVAPPVEFDPLREALRHDAIPMADVMKNIQNRWTDFDLGDSQLAALLSAANEGKRSPAEIGALLRTLLDACQKCHARVLAPLTLDELLLDLKRAGERNALMQEVKVRKVKDLEISEASANVLRAAGANEELVGFLVPDDKVKISPLIGYKTFELKHAEDYDPSAPEGWLKVTAEIPANSSSEFVFKHNALFGRAVSGGEPTVLGAYFNKPAPRNTDFEHIDFTQSLEGGEVTVGDEKRSGGFLGIGKGKSKDDKGKEAPSMDVAYPGADDTGRNSFQIRLANKQSTPQQYSLTIHWMVLAAPKPLTAAPTKPSPAKK